MERIADLDGVKDIHHVHVWEVDEQRRALEAHVAIARQRATELEAIKRRIKECLREGSDISYSTLEFEFSDLSANEAHDTSVIPEHSFRSIKDNKVPLAHFQKSRPQSMLGVGL